jgi:hypothetical protein
MSLRKLLSGKADGAAGAAKRLYRVNTALVTG